MKTRLSNTKASNPKKDKLTMKTEDGKTYLAHTADVVVFNLQATQFRETGCIPNIVLVKRKNEPFKDCWALPGGFLEEGETLEACAKRELEEETGIPSRLSGFLAPLGTFSDPKRDPRGHVISTAFISVIPTAADGISLKAGDDAAECKRFALKGRAYSKGMLNEHGEEVEQDYVFCHLRDAESDARTTFAATFAVDKNGHSNCDIEYDDKSTFKLAFDHAEIIARAIGQCPAVVNPVQNPIERAPEISQGDVNKVVTTTDNL